MSPHTGNGVPTYRQWCPHIQAMVSPHTGNGVPTYRQWCPHIQVSHDSGPTSLIALISENCAKLLSLKINRLAEIDSVLQQLFYVCLEHENGSIKMAVYVENLGVCVYEVTCTSPTHTRTHTHTHAHTHTHTHTHTQVPTSTNHLLHR